MSLLSKSDSIALEQRPISGGESPRGGRRLLCNEPPRGRAVSMPSGSSSSIVDARYSPPPTRKFTSSPRLDRRGMLRFALPRGASDSDDSAGGDDEAGDNTPLELPASATLQGLFAALRELHTTRRSVRQLENELQAFFAVYQLFLSADELAEFFVEQLRDESVSVSLAIVDVDDEAPPLLPRSPPMPLSLSLSLPPKKKNSLPLAGSDGPASSSSSFYTFVIAYWLSWDERADLVATAVRRHLAALERPPAALLQAVESTAPPPSPRAALLPCDVADREAIVNDFWSLSAREAVHCLAAAHGRFRAAIRPWQLLEHNADRRNRECLDCCNHFNALVGWVASAIIKSPTASKRARAISRWVKIADAAYECGEYSVLLVLTNALDHVAVSRLRRSWDVVPAAHYETLQRLLTFCSPCANFKLLREACRLSGRTLPLALVLKDVLFTTEVLPSTPVQDGRIAYERFRQLGKMLVQQTWSSATLSPPAPAAGSLPAAKMPRLLDFLANPVPRYSEEKLFKLSRALEPPNNASPEDLAAAAGQHTVFDNVLYGVQRERPAAEPLESELPVVSAPFDIVHKRHGSAIDDGYAGMPSEWRAQLHAEPDTSVRHGSSPPAKQQAELRQENPFYHLLRQHQQLQQSLLPKTLSSSPPSSSSTSSSSADSLPKCPSSPRCEERHSGSLLRRLSAKRHGDKEKAGPSV